MKVNQKSGSLKVFIVDDSIVIIDRLRKLFSDYKNIEIVGCAGNIADALKEIEESLPDAILIDIHLKKDSPEANGADLLHTLRKIYPSKLLIMVSNLATPQNIEKCMARGADYFLDKTNEFEKIPEILSRIHTADADQGPLNFESL